MRHPLICYFGLAYGISWLVWACLQQRHVALLHAAVDVAFTSVASSPIASNTAGVLITVWGIGVVLMARPHRLASLASLTSKKEYAS